MADAIEGIIESQAAIVAKVQAALLVDGPRIGGIEYGELVKRLAVVVDKYATLRMVERDCKPPDRPRLPPPL